MMTGSHDGGMIPGSHDEDIVQNSHDGHILSGNYDGSIPEIKGGDFIPGSHDENIMPGSHGGGIMPESHGGDIMPGSHGGDTMPEIHSGDIIPRSHGGGIMPDILGGMHRLAKCEKERKKGVYLYREDNAHLIKHLITWNSDGQWYGITPRHFSEMIMGYPGKFMWQPSSGQFDPVCKDIKYTLDDLSDFIFDDNVIDLEKFVMDYFTKSTTGSFAGWINKTYERIETECEMRNILGDTFCGTQDSFKTHLLHRTVMGFPLRKIFQDPTKMCFTPDLLPGAHKKSDQITIDLTNFFDAFAGATVDARADLTVPMLTFHICKTSLCDPSEKSFLL